MFRLKLLTLVGALLIGLMTSIPAFAASNTVIVKDIRLSPGATICLTPLFASTSADAQGTANGGGADFVVYNGAVNATNPVYMVFGAPVFHATFTTTLPMNAIIPGKFKLCATNPSTVNNTRITMSLTTN